MDVYVFGSHAGDLPTHLVGDEAGNRIRGMARLEGGEHDAFYAIEAESLDDVARHLESLTSAGTTVALVLRPHPDWAKSGPVTLPHIPLPPKPMYLPPLELLLFLLLRLERLEEFVLRLIERLGEG